MRKNKKIVQLVDLLRRTQDETSDYVINFLNENGIVYKKDNYGNIFNFDTVNVPLLSAHMDTVRRKYDEKIGKRLAYHNALLATGAILGGDDKCGVSIILTILKEKKNNINFCFSRDEEIGLVGISAIDKTEMEKITKNCLYCLVLDRAGYGDILCTKNNYGSKEFESALEKASKDGGFGFSSAKGTSSDTNVIRNYISSTNLSVGYYNAHTESEYILIADYKNSLDYVNYIIETITDKFEKSAKLNYSYSSWVSAYTTPNKKDVDYYYDYDYEDEIYDYNKGYNDIYKSEPDDDEDYLDFPFEMLETELTFEEFKEYVEDFGLYFYPGDLEGYYEEYLLKVKTNINDSCSKEGCLDSYNSIDNALDSLKKENKEEDGYELFVESADETTKDDLECVCCNNLDKREVYRIDLKDSTIDLCRGCVVDLYVKLKNIIFTDL